MLNDAHLKTLKLAFVVIVKHKFYEEEEEEEEEEETENEVDKKVDNDDEQHL